MIAVVPTGVPNLDTILGGGLPTRTMILLLGVPGTGKTILAEQIAVHQAKQGHRTLIFTALSESHEQLFTGLGTFSFADPALIGDALRFYSVQSALDRGLAAVADLIIETARTERATFVVLDGFHGITGFAEREREVNLFLYTLRSQLSLLNITTLVTYETSPNQRQEAGTLTISDGIFVLHNTLIEERHQRWIEVAKLRGMPHLDGLHSFTITPDGISCYPRQEAIYHTLDYVANDERVSVGLPELDTILEGGFNRGTVTFLAGSPGTGKTLTSLHYLMAGVAAGEPGLLVGLSESAEQLYLKAQHFGLDLRGAVRDGRVTLLMQSLAKLNVDILAANIRERVESLGIKRIVIDSVVAVEQGIPFRNRASRYISSLLDYLRGHEVTTILTQESSAFDGGRMGDALAAMFADNLLVLQWVEYEDRLFRILSVRKMRQSAFDPGLREFRIAEGRIQVLPVEESGITLMRGITEQEQREARIARRNRPQ